MNALEYYLKISEITTHHAFIKLLTKRETMSGIAFSFHQCNIFDDYLMRIYHSVIQYIYILIHHFIKIIIVLPTVLSLPYRTCPFSVSVNSGSPVCNLLDRWCR